MKPSVEPDRMGNRSAAAKNGKTGGNAAVKLRRWQCGGGKTGLGKEKRPRAMTGIGGGQGCRMGSRRPEPYLGGSERSSHPLCRLFLPKRTCTQSPSLFTTWNLSLP